MTSGIQRFCALSGPLFVVGLLVGMLLTGLLPPTSPGTSPEQVVHFWSTHTDLKRLGLMLMMAASALQVPFGALMAGHIKKMEGEFSPLAYTMIVGTSLSVLAILLPVFMFAPAAFRPDRPAADLQTLNDLGWLPFVMNWPPAVIQTLALAFAVLGDRRVKRLWPRWVAYYNMWTAFLFTAGGFAIFFKHGAFAWNGLLAYWMAAVMFGAWFIVMAYLLLKAIGKDTPTAGNPSVVGQ